jgi:hypothetical protein
MKLGNDKGRKEDSFKDDRKIKKLYEADGIKFLMKCFESHVEEVQGRGCVITVKSRGSNREASVELRTSR